VVFLRSKVRVALALIFHVDGDEAYRGVSTDILEAVMIELPDQSPIYAIEAPYIVSMRQCVDSKDSLINVLRSVLQYGAPGFGDGCREP